MLFIKKRIVSKIFAAALSATMPMIMTFGGEMSGQVVSAARAGAFVNLSDYIWDSAKYPNLSQMNKSVAENLTVDVQLINAQRK